MTTIRMLFRCLIPAGMLLTTVGATARAQEDTVSLQRHAAYLEVGGNASRYSINYERTLAARHRLRVGLGLWTDGELMQISETVLMLPVMYNVLIGPAPHFAEIGGGVLVGVVNKDTQVGITNGTYWSATATIGYRHQLPSLGWVFRVGFTPIIGFGDDETAYPRRGFVPRFGVSIGRAFN